MRLAADTSERSAQRASRPGRTVRRVRSSVIRQVARGAAVFVVSAATAFEGRAQEATRTTVDMQEVAGARDSRSSVRPFGILMGTVSEATGRPIHGAIVHLVELPRDPVATDSRGRFVFRNVPTGSRRLLATSIGYAPGRHLVDVAADDTVVLDIVLQRTAIELAGVTVSATATGRDPLAVAQPVTTLGGRDLERSLGATLAHTLSWTSGVSTRSQGPAASMPVIRGMTGERIVVLHDGQRAGDLAASAPDHGVSIDPLAAREVEIVRGPAALLHGSAAVGGVVNVISNDIARLRPSARLASVTFNAETVSEGGGATVDVIQPTDGSLVLRVKGGARSHDNLAIGGDDPRRVLPNTSMRNRHGVVSVTRVGEAYLAGVALRRYDFEYGLPFRLLPAEGVRLRGARDEVSARVEHGSVGAISRVQLDGSVQSYAHDEVLADGVIGTALGVRSWQGRAMARFRDLGPLRSGAVGASWIARRNDVSGAQALTPPNANRTVAFFAFQEIVPFGDAQRPRLPFALRIERASSASETTERFGSSVARDFTNLSASAGLALPVAEGASISMNVARAARVPSPEELFSRAGHAGTGAFEIGNPSLESEYTRGVDIVARVERRSIRAQLALFDNAVAGWIGLYPAGRDTVIAAPGGGAKSLPLYVISQRDAHLRGGEATLEAVFARALVAHLSGDVLHARDRRGGALPFMPPARAGGGVRWDDGRWQFGSAVRHAFAQRRVTEGEVTTDAFTLVEGHLGFRWIGGANAHTVVLRVENLGDRLYRDATSRVKDFAPSAGRNVSLLYRITF